MECVDFGSGDGHYFSLASIDQLIQDANLQNWADVSELVKTHPRKEDYIWYEKEMYHNLGIDHSAYEQDVKRWPYQDMWDRFTKDLPIEIAKKRKYKGMVCHDTSLLVTPVRDRIQIFKFLSNYVPSGVKFSIHFEIDCKKVFFKNRRASCYFDFRPYGTTYMDQNRNQLGKATSPSILQNTFF